MRSLLPLVFAALPLPAAGHGPAPAALSTPAADLAVVRTNIGLAFRRAAGDYRYVCPATWGSEEQFPPVARLPDGRVVVAHAGVAYLIAADGCGVSEAALPDAGSAVAIVAFGDAVLIATREAAGSLLWRVNGVRAPEVVARLPIFVDSMIAREDHVLLAGARPDARLITWPDGAEEALGFDAAFLGLRGDGQFLRASTDQGVVLLERSADRWIERARAERSVHGPVRFAGGWLALIDGVIHQRAGEAGELIAVREARWTCLQRLDDQVLTCADFGMAVVADDLTARAAFSLDAIVGVDCPDDPATHQRCDGQWVHFGAEAGLFEPAAPGAPTEPVEGEPAPPAPAARADDCSVRPRDPAPPWALIGALSGLPLALRRRIATLRPTARRGSDQE